MKDVKICYLINTPWRHIFQRPQILPLLLEKDFDCLVIQKFWVAHLRNPKQSVSPKKMISIFQLPKSDNIPLLHKLSGFYTKRIIKHFIRSSDIVWVCHPSEYKYIPDDYAGKVIYDCMDYYIELSTGKKKQDVEMYERELINRADLIFASSNRLLEYISAPHKTVLLRNGYLEEGNSSALKKPQIKSRYTLCYFGTVSSWFDFGLLKSSLKEIDRIDYRIIGPAKRETVNQFSERRLLFTGVIEHSHLSENIQDCDAFIMPFQLNDLILAVDPVKLYEYIHFGKCIISIRYPEISRFEPFVYFYSTPEEYNALLKQLVDSGFPPKYTEEQRRLFLKENTWEYRYSTIKSSIEDLYTASESNDLKNRSEQQP